MDQVADNQPPDAGCPNCQVPIAMTPDSSKRKPKRVLHFSDGTLEEYSSDEEGVHKVPQDSALVDPSTMPWLPWMAHQAISAGSKALAVCDQVGESLASFLGITGPKYRYEIEEAQRIREEEMAAKKTHDLEMAGWIETATPTTQDRNNADENPPPQLNSPSSVFMQQPAQEPVRY